MSASETSVSAGCAGRSAPAASSSDPLAGIRLTVAPMEGLTGVVFRRLHHRWFGGVDAYGIPFVTPTQEPRFTDRQLRELAPEANAGIPVAPQILTRREEDFLWSARALMEMGYGEVNLNLGCPAGTVTARGRGSGFLRAPAELDIFLSHVTRALPGLPLTVKTRLGWSEPWEFEDLARIYSRHPIRRLIVHPRLKTDAYRGLARWETLRAAMPLLAMPVGVNGDVATPADALALARAFPEAREIMIGRGVIADPAIFRKLRGGPAAKREEVFGFMAELLEGLAEAFDNRRNAVTRMKEHWFYLQFLFEGAEKCVKAILKAKRVEEYDETVRRIRGEIPLRRDARFGWMKPL